MHSSSALPRPRHSEKAVYAAALKRMPRHAHICPRQHAKAEEADSTSLLLPTHNEMKKGR